jgi:hypothetical protein
MRKAIWGSLSLMTASMLCIAYIPQSNSAWWSLVALVVWTISYFLLMHEGKHLAADDEMERNKNIRYINEPSDLILRDPEVTNFKKNKLAADYITIPAMINFNFNPKKKNDYGFSAGISAGFLYSSRQKMVSEERGKEKVKSDFNINPWKIAAIGELNLGLLKFYGSYALTTLHRNGLDQTPFNIGLRFNSW